MAFTGDVSSNPWVVNAADVAGGAVQVWPPPTDTVNFRADATQHVGVILGIEIEFADYVADADMCIVNQGNGKKIWDGNGAADLKTVRSGMLPGPFNGVVIPQGGITNGKILIYHR